jgi:hypothetical protein
MKIQGINSEKWDPSVFCLNINVKKVSRLNRLTFLFLETRQLFIRLSGNSNSVFLLTSKRQFCPNLDDVLGQCEHQRRGKFTGIFMNYFGNSIEYFDNIVIVRDGFIIYIAYIVIAKS